MQFEDCRQKEEAECINACPFHFDVLDFQDKIERHKYDRAYKSYRNTVVFPEIVSRLCPQYCSHVCARKDFDEAVQLRLLEMTCVFRARAKQGTKYNLPKKNDKIGIIGAGVSGLACAIKLLEKKYTVVIFEKEKEIGGQLKNLIPQEIYIPDIMRQLENEDYRLETDREIQKLDDLKEHNFNCIYVATGDGGNDFNTISEKKHYYACQSGVVVLGGGSLNKKEVVASIADGINAAKAIDFFIKTGNFKYDIRRKPTKVVPDIKRLKKQAPIVPTDNGIFTEEETALEAKRCIRCQCNICCTQCDLVNFHKKWPLAMREEIITTVMPAESMIHKAPAIRLVNTCTQCGMFENTCPAHIQLGEMILSARKLLHKQNKMPPAYHGFWLDDMKHANSSVSKICKNAPGRNLSKYAFFPGCNLGAANPEYVEKTYQWLLYHFNDVGLILRCCGIHSLWSGNEDLQNEEIERIRMDWRELGNPTLIAACPSCVQYFREYLPEIKIISLYELMKNSKNWPEANLKLEVKNTHYFIFDPCSAKSDSAIKKSVRTILKKINIVVEENTQNDTYGCCGFGGDAGIANPQFTKYLAKERSELNTNPYITYCINCRDVFIDEKKPVVFILDLLFNINRSNTANPNYTERRENREILNAKLLEHVWKEQTEEDEDKYAFKVVMDEKINDKLQLLKLVASDVKDVMKQSHMMQRRIYDKNTDEYICYAKLNYITCWVRYRIQDNLYYIKDVYTHRMDIQLEDVWNGRKVNANM